MAAIPINAGKQITPKQMVAQWRNLSHKFQVNLWNFEVKAGKAATEIFQESFDLKRFNSRGAAPWAARSKHSKVKHPLMTETYSLKNQLSGSIWEIRLLHLGLRFLLTRMDLHIQKAIKVFALRLCITLQHHLVHVGAGLKICHAVNSWVIQAYCVKN